MSLAVNNGQVTSMARGAKALEPEAEERGGRVLELDLVDLRGGREETAKQLSF